MSHDALSKRPDDVQPGRINIVQHDLGDWKFISESRNTVDEFWCVRRPSADNGEFHPLIPVNVTPSTNAFWAKKNSTNTGSIANMVAAMVRFHWT